MRSFTGKTVLITGAPVRTGYAASKHAMAIRERR